MSIRSNDLTQVIPARKRGISGFNPFEKRTASPSMRKHPMPLCPAEPLAALEARNISA